MASGIRTRSIKERENRGRNHPRYKELLNKDAISRCMLYHFLVKEILVNEIGLVCYQTKLSSFSTIVIRLLSCIPIQLFLRIRSMPQSNRRRQLFLFVVCEPNWRYEIQIFFNMHIMQLLPVEKIELDSPIANKRRTYTKGNFHPRHAISQHERKKTKLEQTQTNLEQLHDLCSIDSKETLETQWAAGKH